MGFAGEPGFPFATNGRGRLRLRHWQQHQKLALIVFIVTPMADNYITTDGEGKMP